MHLTGTDGENKTCCSRGLLIAGTVIIACLIFVGLVAKMREYTTPAPIGEKRMAERAKALSDLRGVEADALQHNGWVDQTKGIVRLSIDDAKALTVREWQNPAQARSNLFARVAKANYVPPPPVNPLE